MEASHAQHVLYCKILRLLFKFNLVPRTAKDEEEFIKELVKIIKI